MKELYDDLKTRYGKAIITLTDIENIEVQFSNALEPVIIQKGLEKERYIVSYPQEKTDRKGSSIEHTTSHNILIEGLLWILKKVNQNGYISR
jgi:hypothetical protein